MHPSYLLVCLYLVHGVVGRSCGALKAGEVCAAGGDVGSSCGGGPCIGTSHLQEMSLSHCQTPTSLPGEPLEILQLLSHKALYHLHLHRFLKFYCLVVCFFLLLFASFAYNNLLYLRCSSSRDCFFSFLCFACNGKSLITAFLFIVSNDLNACCSWNMHMINNYNYEKMIKARGLVSSQT